VCIRRLHNSTRNQYYRTFCTLEDHDALDSGLVAYREAQTPERYQFMIVLIQGEHILPEVRSLQNGYPAQRPDLVRGTSLWYTMSMSMNWCERKMFQSRTRGESLSSVCDPENSKLCAAMPAPVGRFVSYAFTYSQFAQVTTAVHLPQPRVLPASITSQH
jgi:hypothetical protein